MEDKYRIYIDEVGNSDLASADNPNHRFLSLTGVIISLSYVRHVLFQEMENLKNRFFDHHPDAPLIFHRKDMLNKRGPFSPLRNAGIERKFNEELLKALTEWEYSVITAVIDKKAHRQQYKTWRYDPYHYCLAVLLERYIFFLDRADRKGDVLAESRGGKEDMRLKKSYIRIFEEGTNYIEAIRFQDRLSSRELKVKSKSNNISGLQLADLIAHPSRREILVEYGKIDDRREIFGDKIVKILQHKYYREGGHIYGKKMLP